MNPHALRRLFSFSLSVVLLFAVSAQAAGKRRAVSHPGPSGDLLTASLITGVVLDATTGKPINAARVTIGNRTDITSVDGKFDGKNVSSYGSILVEASRSGYVTGSVKLNASGDQQVTLRLTPTPTVHVKKTDNSTVEVDYESVEFGYAVPFSGYRKYDYEDFCKNGSPIVVNRTDVKRITGPATVVQGASACCSDKSVLKINVETKTGGASDLTFLDSCEAGVTRIDLIARDHVQGGFLYIPFTEISEVVFP